MSVNVLGNEEVVELLKKASGLDNDEGNPRLKQIMHRLLTDLFRAIDDLDITSEEFWVAANYLNDLGATKEAVLLAPGLGFDRLLDIILDEKEAQAGINGGTPRTIEGPLYVEGAPLFKGKGKSDIDVSDAQEMYLHGKVTDLDGNPVAGAIVDVWHADKKGAYSFFDPSQSQYNLRCRIETDEQGRYAVMSRVPNGYGVPPDGNTKIVLDGLGRHGNRPAHIHYFASKPGYKHLTTQINLAGDKYLHDDFAYATRDELIVTGVEVVDAAKIAELGFESAYLEVEFDIQLPTTSDEELQHAHPRARAST